MQHGRPGIRKHPLPQEGVMTVVRAHTSPATNAHNKCHCFTASFPRVEQHVLVISSCAYGQESKGSLEPVTSEGGDSIQSERPYLGLLLLDRNTCHKIVWISNSGRCSVNCNGRPNSARLGENEALRKTPQERAHRMTTLRTCQAVARLKYQKKMTQVLCTYLQHVTDH